MHAKQISKGFKSYIQANPPTKSCHDSPNVKSENFEKTTIKHQHAPPTLIQHIVLNGTIKTKQEVHVIGKGSKQSKKDISNIKSIQFGEACLFTTQTQKLQNTQKKQLPFTTRIVPSPTLIYDYRSNTRYDKEINDIR